MKKRIWVALSLSMIIVLAGCNLFSGSESVTPPPEEDPQEYVFFDDFSDDTVGKPPSKWILSNTIPQYGTIEVVADDGVPSGRAVHIGTVHHDGSIVSVNMRTPLFGEMAHGAKTMAIEYWHKWVEGGAIYHYITTGSTHRTTFFTSGNDFRNRETHDGKSTIVPVTGLTEGWNQIRAIVNRETNSIVFYVNDMENPIPGTFETYTPMDEGWEDLRFLIVHETNKDQIREAYYSGFKVWVVE